MVLTDEEIKSIRQSIETQAGLDPELLQRCGHLIHIGAFDEAVRNAFVLLEERLRTAVNEDGMTGTKLANHAFGPNGPLAKQLSHKTDEQEGLRELYSGAFKLFRNPAAHGVVGYDSAHGKSVIALVNLLLRILSRATDTASVVLLPANVQKIMSQTEVPLGPNPTSRLQTFLIKCIKAGLKPPATPKHWVPFRRNALVKYPHWSKPKSFSITMFYLIGEESTHLRFPINQYYTNIIGFDTANLKQQLVGLGFQAGGKHQDYSIDLHIRNDQMFFEKLLAAILQASEQMEARLK